MKFRARKTFRIGPFSHNFTRRTSHVDTPGLGGFTHQHGRKR